MLRSKAWEMALSLIRAEEERAQVDVPERRMTTHVHEALNVEVRNRTALFECDWTGTVSEISLKADRQDFRLRVTNERGEIYNEPYSWFVAHGQELEGVGAFEVDGVYVLHLSGLSFRGYFKLEVIPAAPTVVSLFMIKVERGG